MSATYTKLRDGSWGVRVEGTAKAGQSVTVAKRSGETKTEVIGKVVWSGNGISLCSIGGGSSTPAPRSSGRSSGGNVCCECGKGGRLVSDLEDGGMKHYNCCDMPPGGY